MFGRATLMVVTMFAAAAQAGSLIPRERLFGPPAHSWPALSPDGRHLAYLAPDKAGVMNIWLAKPAAGEPQGRMLTHDSRRGIFGYRWAEDDRHILYWQDEDGDEIWHLFAVDIGTGQSRDLTPMQGVQAQNLLTDFRHPHQVLIGLNASDPAMFDLYRIDLETGDLTLDTKNPGDVLSWTADADFVIRAATAYDPASGDTQLRVRDAGSAPWRILARWPFHESPFLGQINGGLVAQGFTADSKALYAVTHEGSDKSHLGTIELATGKLKVVAAADSDVAEAPDFGPGAQLNDHQSIVLRNPGTGEVDAVAFEGAERRWKAVAPSLEPDLAFLASQLHGFPYVISRDRKDSRWVVADWSADRPLGYFLYDRKAKKLASLFSEEPGLRDAGLPQPQPGEITARDGRKIPIYLTRAQDKEPGPLLLLPHGGPWFRDHLDFDPMVQFFANRGYTVLQVQYRGSTGYGREFFNAGDHQFGLAMRDDLIDATEWAIREGIADPGRIGVFGISAGGYLALRVTEARPDLFRATIDMVGPTNVKFMLDTMNSNSLLIKSRWVRRVGDPSADPDLGKRLSPHFSGQALGGAFLVGQGANDPRVPRAHSDAIVGDLRRSGATVDYLVYLDEGHGWVRPENNLDFFGRVEEFLAKHLGGRAEPWREIPGANVEVK